MPHRSKAELLQWIAFRIKHPKLGGLRCAVCEMRGGTVVSGEVGEAIKGLPELAGRDLVEGEYLTLPPCQPRHVLTHPEAPWRKAGRQCPFVELSPANGPAADVVTYALVEHTRPLSTLYAEEIVQTLPPLDRVAFVDRVLAALHCEAVRQKMLPDESEGAARG